MTPSRLRIFLSMFGAAPTTAQRFHFHGDSFSCSRVLRSSNFTFGKHACHAKIIARRSVEFRAGRVSQSNPPTVWTASKCELIVNFIIYVSKHYLLYTWKVDGG